VSVGRWRKQLAAAVVQICQERITQNLTNQKMEVLTLILPHIQQVAEQDAQVLSQEDLLWPYEGLARLAEYQANFADALKWCELGLNLCELQLGPKDPTTASALNNVAQLLGDSLRQAEAVPLMRRALAIDEASYGPDHHKLIATLGNQAKVLHVAKRVPEAETLMRRSLAITEATYGLDHPQTETDLSNLASLLCATNQISETEPLVRRMLKILITCSARGI
jgi:tetratricopeptide (TPR) repeat protein